MEGIEDKVKDEIREHLPKWVRILGEYFRNGYQNYLVNKARYQSKNEPREY